VKEGEKKEKGKEEGASLPVFPLSMVPPGGEERSEGKGGKKKEKREGGKGIGVPFPILFLSFR